MPITSLILTTNSAFSTSCFTFHFWLVIMKGLTFSTCESRELCKIWKIYDFLNLYSSTSDVVGSFSFIDKLYNAMFAKDLGIPNYFFRYWLNTPLFWLLLVIPHLSELAIIIQKLTQNKYTIIYVNQRGHIYQWSVIHTLVVWLNLASNVNQ